MRCPSSLWLCSLFALLSTANASVVISSPDACAIQAWVRAPDLDPGEIIPGQVRVKTKGSCNPILEYSVILRFKERVWAKIAYLHSLQFRQCPFHSNFIFFPSENPVSNQLKGRNLSIFWVTIFRHSNGKSNGTAQKEDSLDQFVKVLKPVYGTDTLKRCILPCGF